MLLCIAVLAITLFFPYSTGEGGFLGGYNSGGVFLVTGVGGFSVPPAGIGWELAPLAIPVMLILLLLYLGDPDENVPLFRSVGWWVTPFVPFATITVMGYDTPAVIIGAIAELGMLIAAGLHFFEQRAARRRAASPPSA